MLLNTATVFAATESYNAGYDAGYKIGFDKADSNVSARSYYRNTYKDSSKHKSIIKQIVNYDEIEFEDGFIDGYNDGSDDGYDDKYDKSKTDQKVEYASTLGKLLGENYGAKDFQDGENSAWKSVLPSRSAVSDMFNLDKQSSAYKNAFIDEFNKAFEAGYIDAYDKAMFEPDKITLEQGVLDGEESGKILGAAFGAKDFYEGNDSNFFRDMLEDEEIISQYSLNNDSAEYEDGFIAGFIRAYEESYNEAYRAANMTESVGKMTSEIIPIAGGEVASADNKFAVNIPAGTFYHDVSLSIRTTNDVSNKGNLIKASNSYTVSIANSSGNVDDKNTIEVSFEYYGNKLKGGIYRQNGNEWLYIPTVIKDNEMIAEINPSSLNSHDITFSAFVDNNMSVFRDARGHWASDEIDAYVRRGIISGYSDNTFRPDNNISRAEFLTLLSRVYNWNTSYYPGSTIAFKDENTFGYYSNIINFAASNKYISGYGDGTFKPNNPISYAEVEIIMKRVVPYGNYKWIDTAIGMLYEKKVRTRSFNSMNNKITRAEIAYMLYSVTE